MYFSSASFPPQKKPTKTQQSTGLHQSCFCWEQGVPGHLKIWRSSLHLLLEWSHSRVTATDAVVEKNPRISNKQHSKVTPSCQSIPHCPRLSSVLLHQAGAPAGAEPGSQGAAGAGHSISDLPRSTQGDGGCWQPIKHPRWAQNRHTRSTHLGEWMVSPHPPCAQLSDAISSRIAYA